MWKRIVAWSSGIAALVSLVTPSIAEIIKR